MCIIIKNTTGKPISPAIVKRCVTINQDGFGIVYLDGKTGDFRTLDMGLAERILSTETRPYVAHCRFATVGETNSDGIHPFPIGKGRYLFQNGTIAVTDETTSDTLQLAGMLRGLSDDRVAFILTALDGCRWSVVDTKKQTAKIFGRWHTKNGIEYSKDNVLSDPSPVYSYQCKYDGGYGGSYTGWAGETAAAVDNARRTTIGVYGTLKYGHGNHGLIKDSDFLGYGYTANKMRLCIEGLPFLIRGKHGSGRNVEIECYSVDDKTLAEVDSLEGHPEFYRRDVIGVRLDTKATTDGNINAAVYMVGKDYDSGVYHETF